MFKYLIKLEKRVIAQQVPNQLHAQELLNSMVFEQGRQLVRSFKKTRLGMPVPLRFKLRPANNRYSTSAVLKNKNLHRGL